MGPVRQNPVQRTVRTAHLSVLMTAEFQYTRQHRTVLIISRLTSGVQTCTNMHYVSSVQVNNMKQRDRVDTVFVGAV